MTSFISLLRALRFPPLLPSQIIERGPLRAAVEFTYTSSSSLHIHQRVYVEMRSALVTFDTKIYWNEARKLLRVEFPTSIRSPHASYETQYGFVQRPTHFNTSWDAAKFEVSFK